MTDSRSKNSASRQAWLVCLIAGLFFFYEFFQLNVFDVINPTLRLDFHIQAVQLSWMSSTFVWANVLFLLPAGFILDRYPVRHVILIALASCVLGTFGFALSHSFAWATKWHALTGVGNAFCFLSCVVLVSRWFEPRKQALVIGSIVTMAFLGGMMAHTPFAYLAHHFGWRGAMLINAFFGAFILVLIALIVDNPKAFVNHANRSSNGLSDMRQAFKTPQNFLAGLYTACLNLPIMVLCALWGGSYLMTVHHLPSLISSNIISLIFIGSIIGCPFMGWLSDQHAQRKPIMIAGALLTGIALLPLCLQVTLSTLELCILFFSLGFFTSTQVISYPLIAESNPPSQTGSATGLASVVIMGTAGLAQILFGWLIHSHSTATALTPADFQSAFWIFPVATLFALISSISLRETNCMPLNKWS